MLNIKNKKAQEVAITIFVIMVLSVVGYALYTFAISSKTITVKVSDSYVLNELYAREDFARSYINQAGEEASIKAYIKTIENGDYTSSIIRKNNFFEFADLNPKLNEKMAFYFKEAFIEEFNKYKFNEEDSYMKKIKENLNDMNIEYSNGVFYLTIKGFELKGKTENSEMIYSPEIKSEFELYKLGLDSFEDIKKAKDECMNNNELLEECMFKKLFHFNVFKAGTSELAGQGEVSLTLTSKKKFLIDNQIKQFTFGFIPK